MSEQKQQAQDALEQLGTVGSYDEKVQEFLQYMQDNFDPMDFMPPSQREIMRMPAEQFQVEYELVVKKESGRSAAQRRYILERYEQEQNATRETTDQQDSDNA